MTFDTQHTHKRMLISWTCQILAVIIMGQTLYFKFTGADESVEIFTRIGLEPWGRIAIGFLELTAAILLLIRPVIWLGALMGLGLMSGALFFHATVLGISVRNDGGYLLVLALMVWLASLVVLWIRRNEIPVLNKWLVTHIK